MNLNDALTTQHADYDADLEPDNDGLDDCPFDTTTIVPDDETDITPTRPCNICGFTDCTPDCLDQDSPFGHITARRGW